MTSRRCSGWRDGNINQLTGGTLNQPSLARAARYVIEHCHDWDGEAYEIVEPAAERLSAAHPVAASLLLRSMVVFALSMGRSKRYRHAAEHLRQCERLEARIDDWQIGRAHV